MWEHLKSQKLQHSSWEGGSASHQAKSKGSHPKYKGGVGQHGGHQSSSHHRGINQGHSGSSSHEGPPRPKSSSKVMSGSLVFITLGQYQSREPMGPLGQAMTQPNEQDRSWGNQVRDSSVCQFHFLYRILEELFISIIFFLLWGSCFLQNVTFRQIFLV